MEYYQRCSSTDEYLDFDIPGADTSKADLLFVTQNCRPNVIISSALASLKQKKSLLWVGIGSAIDKEILCANITKNRAKIGYEITHVAYKRVVEYWEPVLEGLDKIQVTREIPTMLILQSQAHPS